MKRHARQYLALAAVLALLIVGTVAMKAGQPYDVLQACTRACAVQYYSAVMACNGNSQCHMQAHLAYRQCTQACLSPSQ